MISPGPVQQWQHGPKNAVVILLDSLNRHMLGAYGGTGVNASDSMAYTYWCAEKGYARHVGPRALDDGWARRAKGWIRVMQIDTLLTLVVLTIATVPFYMLGAGVLERLGLVPSGTETIRMLSHMYTETLGPGASVVFLFGENFNAKDAYRVELQGNAVAQVLDLTGTSGDADGAPWETGAQLQPCLVARSPAPDVLWIVDDRTADVGVPTFDVWTSGATSGSLGLADLTQVPELRAAAGGQALAGFRTASKSGLALLAPGVPADTLLSVSAAITLQGPEDSIVQGVEFKFWHD